jgi:hypothetical protein
MTGPGQPVGQAAKFVDTCFDSFRNITANASTTDKAGEWSLNGWVRVIHELVDLQVRTYAAIVQATISGPWWTGAINEPLPPDPVTVKAAKYPRKLTLSTFRRVGYPQTTVAPPSLGVEPSILPAGVDEFRIVLNDPRFVGANYQGTVTLTDASGAGMKAQQIEVTVGL